MRWKLLRRRLSVSAPRMIVRSRLPWPLRWVVAAVALGFSAALALWAFEFGKSIAGLGSGTQDELSRLRVELVQLKADHEQARQVADTAESLLKAERAAQEGLARQLRQAEAGRQALQADLGFFERLLPGTGSGVQLRGLEVELTAPGQLRYRMLVVQNGKPANEFQGSYELVLGGLLDGVPWNQALPTGPRPLRLRQYSRVEDTLEYPPHAVIKTVQARLMDLHGATRATQSVKPMP
jgi:hypothetical protein